jgi:hypothetical protein
MVCSVAIKLWVETKVALGEIFCMSERIMNLPKQDKFDTKQLGEWKLPDFKPLFDSNEFVPTGEDAATYQDDPDQSDTRAWRTMSHGDFLTKRFRQASPWIDEHILARWRWLVHGIKPTNVRKTSSKNLSHLVGAMDNTDLSVCVTVTGTHCCGACTRSPSVDSDYAYRHLRHPVRSLVEADGWKSYAG